jgi:hypothetical protein
MQKYILKFSVVLCLTFTLYSSAIFANQQSDNEEGSGPIPSSIGDIPSKPHEDNTDPNKSEPFQVSELSYELLKKAYDKLAAKVKNSPCIVYEDVPYTQCNDTSYKNTGTGDTLSNIVRNIRVSGEEALRSGFEIFSQLPKGLSGQVIKGGPLVNNENDEKKSQEVGTTTTRNILAQIDDIHRYLDTTEPSDENKILLKAYLKKLSEYINTIAINKEKPQFCTIYPEDAGEKFTCDNNIFEKVRNPIGETNDTPEEKITEGNSKDLDNEPSNTNARHPTIDE